MSKPLTFLYPIFYRSVRPASQKSPPLKQSRSHSHSISTTTRRREVRPERYGTALGGGDIPVVSSDTQAPIAPAKAGSSQTKESQNAPPAPPPEENPVKASKTEELDSAESTPSTPTPDAPLVAQSNPLENVLRLPSPSEESKKAPHLQAPRYVHHVRICVVKFLLSYANASKFDTYGLVKDLEASGFSQGQSVSIMKAVRGILTDNMELARDGLVSKSNVENETYLFRAACSELRTEIANNRNTETEKMRTARTNLQHEVDILNQRMTQESLTLKDELKGMFDDRKMAVRTEQRNMETKIQELGYKITVALNSDARSEVEGLRWVLTRRAAIAIGISAALILGTLRYSSYMTKTQEAERKKLKEEARHADSERASPSNGDHGSAGTNGSPKAPVLGGEALGGELLVGEGGVQLG
ncbi:uncharacterized protein BDZ99DRAFT_560544 [Mytilinidion resinicola]|uniref:DUF1640-domain-containing protein n=1 Tax=Mytilinidion resinicola TaxID=574789 RepID=A0A6A6YVD3_9PEZI|nr:uncharacterized protein BDZ99DRAFT_560544 [Mytilinidion resinicola]KAF2811917.1 hypothetical protein BDZ99DRAFT_560544 [Mytilinidion resinicola]